MSYMIPHTVTYASAIKYAGDGSTVTFDLRTLASLVPAHLGNSFYFPITIPRNIVPPPESESDDEPEIPKDELRKINKALTDLSFDLDRVWNAVKKLQGSSSSSASSSDSDYASSNESERFIETLPSPPLLRRQTAIYVSSDEEKCVKDDIPLAPGKYKKKCKDHALV